MPMSGMARLKRVFAIDLSRSPNCGGELRVIGAITDPGGIARILERRGLDGGEQPRPPAPAVCTGELN
jgi:hypothetical protein